MDLRDYQARAVAEVSERIDSTPTILCFPTGGGKTVAAVAIAKPYRTLWVAHRRELIYQAAAALRAAGADPGIILPGEPLRPNQPIQVASVQTLARRGACPPCDLLVCDEVHHFCSSSYGVLQAPRMLGLTATPWRLDGRGLQPPFQRLVTGATAQELCERGYLVDPDVFVPSSPNLRGVRTRAGDFAVNELALRMDKITGRIVEHWMKLGRAADGTPRRTVCFAVNIAHSKSIVERFVAAGVKAVHLDAKASVDERALVLGQLARGEIHVLSNVGLVTEGWDLPSLEVAIIARPTQSLGLHLQMIGRIARACENKAGATVLDHAGNHLRHGRMTDERTFTLAGVVKRHAVGAGVRHCPACYLLLRVGTSVCPVCGAELRLPPRELEELDGDLTKMGSRVEVPFATKLEYWLSLEGERIARNFREGWSKARWKLRFGEWPVVVGGTLIDPKNAPAGARAQVLAELRAVAAEKGYKKGWVGYRYKARFGHWPRKF